LGVVCRRSKQTRGDVRSSGQSHRDLLDLLELRISRPAPVISTNAIATSITNQPGTDPARRVRCPRPRCLFHCVREVEGVSPHRGKRPQNTPVITRGRQREEQHAAVMVNFHLARLEKGASANLSADIIPSRALARAVRPCREQHLSLLGTWRTPAAARAERGRGIATRRRSRAGALED